MALGDPLITNAVVSVTRAGAAIANMSHINVYIKPVTMQNLDMQGVPQSFDVLGGYADARPTSWHVGDQMTLESFPAAQVTTYTVQAILTLPIGALPVWAVRVAGRIR